MHRRFGWRAVCWFTTERNWPVDIEETRDSELIAAAFFCPPDRFSVGCAHLKAHHQIRAVVPQCETTVTLAAELDEHLGLKIWSNDTLFRFRDKGRLKQYLAEVDPSIRLNLAQTVETPQQALELVRERGLDRYVIKPNSGFANENIGFFDRASTRVDLEEHWARNRGTRWLLEAYISGEEYHCNGQVDAEGNITIIDIGMTHVTETRERGGICTRTDQMPTTDPVFGEIADYSRRIIAASGLRRSPFHAELRRTAEGPVLIECAARIIGAEYAFLLSEMHGSAFDPFELAAHYYGSAKPYGPIGLDWDSYNARLFFKIRGVCEKATQVYSWEGVEAVTQGAHFYRWISTPFIGQRLQPTNSLGNSSYALILRTSDPEERDEVEAWVRATLRINPRPISGRKKATLWWIRLSGRLRLWGRRLRRLSRKPVLVIN